MRKIIVFVGMTLFFGVCFCYAQDQITVTTYYPSPYGVYNSLLADKLGIGDNDNDGNLTSADVPTASGDVWIRGNVGIGTTAPGAYRLYVNGNMYVNGDITTDAATYPDYVFESGYKLITLKELKEFIKENKHLPGMTSAKKAKDEGIKIFEQNRLILEKLEEAYLYIIELQEKIEKLEAAIQIN